MAENLSPFVYWGQNSDTIFLKVDIKEVTVSILKDHILVDIKYTVLINMHVSVCRYSPSNHIIPSTVNPDSSQPCRLGIGHAPLNSLVYVYLCNVLAVSFSALLKQTNKVPFQ